MGNYLKDKRSSMIKAPEVTLMLQKDMTTHLPMTCPLFEYAILEVVHPEATLEIKSVGLMKEYAREKEMDRMGQKYGSNPKTEDLYADEVYGRNGRDIEAIVEQLTEELGIEAGKVDHKKLEVDEMSADDLRKELRKREIDFPKTASKARLLSILKSAMDDGPGDEEDEEGEGEEGKTGGATA